MCDAIGSMDASRKVHHGHPTIQGGDNGALQASREYHKDDIDHAAVTGSAIVAFPIDIPKSLAKYAEHVKVKMMQHQVIYHLMEEIKQELVARLPPMVSEELVSKAKVLKIFTQSDGDKVYGLHVIQGILNSRRNSSHSMQVVRSEQRIGRCGGCVDEAGEAGSARSWSGHAMWSDDQDGFDRNDGGGESCYDWEIKEGDELRMYKRVSKEATL